MTDEQRGLIPATAHFIWLGPTLPAIPWLAIRAASARGGFERVVLHGDDPALAQDPPVAALLNDERLRFQQVSDTSLFNGALRAGLGDATVAKLAALWPRLDIPAMRADLVRLVVLWQVGGVYLDADAIVLRSFDELRKKPGFAGLERIALPDTVRSSRNPGTWLKAGGLLAARDVLSRLAVGPKLFAAIERLYAPAVNNAILGACPGDAVIEAALREVAGMPVQQATTLYELGPRLLQRVTKNRSTDQFHIAPPVVFYPLPPEMSQHYFRPSDAAIDRALLSEQTVAVHLYDSVARRREGKALDAAWVLAQAGKTPFSRMVAPWLGDIAAVFGVP